MAETSGTGKIIAMKAERAESRIERLIREHGGRYSSELGIDVESKKSDEIFRWFLASLLFGARISREIAKKTYRKFEAAGITTPEAILSTGWHGMIPVLGAGGYARYDNRTANKLLGVAEKLRHEYGGNIVKLFDESGTPGELERRLLDFKGVGETTVNIFLRELRGVFPQASPPLSKRAIKAARREGFVTTDDPSEALRQLEGLWERNKVAGYRFSDFEAALIRSA